MAGKRRKGLAAWRRPKACVACLGPRAFMARDTELGMGETILR